MSFMTDNADFKYLYALKLLDMLERTSITSDKV